MADIKINVQVVEGQAIAAMKGIENATKGAEKEVANLNLSFKGVSTAAVAVGGVIANLATKAIDQMAEAVSHLIGGGLDLTAQIQNLTFQFQALLPVTQDAKKFLEQIGELSDKSPFEFPELANAAKNLLTFGINANDVEETLRVLGDVATASGANIEQLSLAFAKVSETGVLSGRELNEFRNNGIPIIQELSKELGVSTGAVRKLANDGKIDFKTFEQAITGLTKEGGFAFDSMNKKALTLDGSNKKLHDSTEGLQRLFGDNLAPVVILVRQGISSLIDQVTAFLKETDALDTAVKASIIGFELLVDIGVILYNSFNGIRFVVAEVGAVLIKALLIPVNNVLTGIELLIRGLSLASGALGLNNTALQNAADSIKNFKDVLNTVPADVHQFAQDIATDMTATSQKADAFKTKVEDAYIGLAANLKSAAKGTKAASDEIEAGLTEAQKAALQKRLENEIKFNEAVLAEKNKAALAQQELIFLEDGKISEAEELALIEQQDRFARELEMQKEQNLQKQIEQDIAFQVEQQQLIDHQNALAVLQEQNQANQLARDLAYRQKLAAQQQKSNEAQKQLDTSLATAKEGIVKQSFALAAAVAKNGSKEQFVIQKAAALAEIGIARGKALALIPAQTATIPYPANLAAIAQMTALVNLQAALGAATVIATAIQGFQSGGIVGGNSFSGDNVLARVNSGEMILNRQQQSTLFNLANNGGGNGQIIEVHTTVQLDGEAVGRSVSRQVANGLQLGEVV